MKLIELLEGDVIKWPYKRQLKRQRDKQDKDLTKKGKYRDKATGEIRAGKLTYMGLLTDKKEG